MQVEQSDQGLVQKFYNQRVLKVYSIIVEKWSLSQSN